MPSLDKYDKFVMVCKICSRIIAIGHKYRKQNGKFAIQARVRKRNTEQLPETHGYTHNMAMHDKDRDDMSDYDWIPLRLNVLTENNYLVVLTDTMKYYKIELDGSIKECESVDENEAFEYEAFDNFYVHSGASEMITYNTIGQEGQIIEVNRFRAVNPNPGIKRVNGTKG